MRCLLPAIEARRFMELELAALVHRLPTSRDGANVAKIPSLSLVAWGKQNGGGNASVFETK